MSKIQSHKEIESQMHSSGTLNRESKARKTVGEN